MTVQNDFVPFAVGSGANVLSQPQYLALTSLIANGMVAGTAQSASANKVWRQSSLIAAAIAQLVVDVIGLPMVDSGQVLPLESGILLALLSVGVVMDQSPNVNVITGSLTPAIQNYLQGQRFTVYPAQTNTGPVQASFGGGYIPVLSPNGALLGGEMKANAPSVLIYSQASNAFVLQAASTSGGTVTVANEPLYLYNHFGSV